MSKKILGYLSSILGVVTIIGVLVWGYYAKDENGIVHLEGNEMYAAIFLVLASLALITGAISLRASIEKGDKISRKAVLSGLAVAGIIFLWRLSVTM
jgi:hypothetical protein